MSITEPAQIAADYIGQFDASLASLFLRQPFNRVAMAKAFAAGVSTPAGSHDYEMGLTIIALAELDRDERIAA